MTIGPQSSSPRFKLPAVERVRELFDYDPKTGLLTRRTDVPKAKAGSIAGTLNNKGHLICRVDRVIYYVHRLIWLHYFGETPPELIDHANGKRDDNRVSNLRPADYCENLWNRGAMPRNKSGVKGAHYSKAERKWKSSIRVRGRVIHLGYFETSEEAGAAYAAAAARYHQEFSKI